MATGNRYEKGSAKLVFESYEWCKDEAEVRARMEDGEEFPQKVVVLPHQCEEWSIGGLVELDAFIADLQALRAQLSEE